MRRLGGNRELLGGIAVAAVVLVTGVVALVIIGRGHDTAERGDGPPLSNRPPGTVTAFLGDSYTHGFAATATDRRWSSLVAAHFGWSERNFGADGTGYLQGSPAGQPYRGRIKTVAAARPQLVIVSGGLNDLALMAQAPAAESAAVRRTFATLRRVLPDADIVALRPFWPATPEPAALDTLDEEVRTAVRSVGGVYVDIGRPLAGRTQDIATDGVHPNDAGHAQLALAIEQAFIRTRLPK